MRLGGTASACTILMSSRELRSNSTMLRLTFKALGRSRSLESPEGIELRGSELFSAGSTTSRARYSLGYWLFANERWPSAECDSHVVIRFEDSNGDVGPVIGPRPSMRIRDRFLFAGRERIATLLPEESRWRVVGGHQSWPILKIQPYQPS